MMVAEQGFEPWYAARSIMPHEKGTTVMIVIIMVMVIVIVMSSYVGINPREQCQYHDQCQCYFFHASSNTCITWNPAIADDDSRFDRDGRILNPEGNVKEKPGVLFEQVLYTQAGSHVNCLFQEGSGI